MGLIVKRVLLVVLIYLALMVSCQAKEFHEAYDNRNIELGD